MIGLRWAAGLAGAAILVLTWLSLVKTLIVPRRTRSALIKIIGNVSRRSLLFFADRFDDYLKRDRLLTYVAPVVLLAELVAWMTGFFLAYGLVIWGLTGGDIFIAFRESGSSLLTLGLAGGERFLPSVIYFLAAATGLVVVALLIAYLPALYGAFNRRETLVTTLQSRAGVPAWGPEILARHRLVELTDDLAAFYRDWEQWAADVAESHTNYPILIFFRSPHPLRSWLIGLLAVLDSAALYLALSPGKAPSQARLCLRMGFLCLRDIADAMGLEYDPDPFPDDPVQLSFEEFKEAVARLEEMDFEMERSAEEAWVHFRGWRVNYESIVYRLADAVVAPPGPWSGHRSHPADTTIVPKRPYDRRPGEKQEEEAKTDSSTWRLRG
jgi:hypothetical protein